MKLEDLAQNAARQARSAAQEMPIVPITAARRQHRAFRVFVPILGVAAAWVTVAVLTPPPTATPSVATNPAATTIGNTETTTAIPNMFQTVTVTRDDMGTFAQLTDSILPVGTQDGCCIGYDLPGGEMFMFGRDRVSKFTDRAEQLFSWKAFDAKAFIPVSGEIAIAGVTDSGNSELRKYTRDGTLVWNLGIDFELDHRSQLAIDQAGRIWVSVHDLFPADSGFAVTQWFVIANADGTPVPDPPRSEARPLPDGRSIQIAAHSASLTSLEGPGVRWELPDDLTVLSADPFLDGLLVTATNDPTAELGQTVALSLQPNAAVTGFWLDRYWGDIVPGPSNIVANNGALYGLGRNTEGLFLSITELEILHPLPPFSLSGVQWIGSDHQTIRLQTGNVLARGNYPFPGRGTAWDGNTGLVTLDRDRLTWLRPNSRPTVAPNGRFISEIVEVAEGDVEPFILVRLLEDPSTTLWMRFSTGYVVDQPESARTVDGQTFTAQGRTATIAQPDWSNVERGEASELIRPYDLPELVVTSQDGTELLRMVVGTNDRPFVRIHDFDGRRLILDATPQEPASPPQTVWVIDLECADCTREFRTPGPFWFDLIGTVETENEVVRPIVESEPAQFWPRP